MAIQIDELARDMVNLDFAAAVNKYKGKLAANSIKISQVVASLEGQGLLKLLVRSDWQDGGSGRNGLYLIDVDGNFEVFVGERGIKNWKQTFTDLKSASFAWTDSMLNELLYSAPDSQIK